MPILVFDTETNGLDHPRVVQLAAVMANDQYEEIACFSTLIRPDNWVMSSGAEGIHGISDAMCIENGISIAAAMHVLNEMANCCSTYVAHNADFDVRVISGEYTRMGKTSCPFTSLGDGKKVFCTMKAAIDICKLPGKNGRFKWPKLVEAHTHLLGKGFEGAHNALSDVRACLAVYTAIKAVNCISNFGIGTR